MNSVVFVGICREVTAVSITLESETGKQFQMFFASKQDPKSLELNILTKIEGYIDVREFPFPIVIVGKVYQIKKEIN